MFPFRPQGTPYDFCCDPFYGVKKYSLIWFKIYAWIIKDDILEYWIPHWFPKKITPWTEDQKKIRKLAGLHDSEGYVKNKEGLL